MRHGAARRGRITREYMIWKAIKARCYNVNDKRFDRYGGRGIEMCDDWINDFGAFLRDMGARQEGTSIERRDNDGPYGKQNCYWATRTAQANNKSSNRQIRVFGGSMTLMQCARFMGVRWTVLRGRLNLGWSLGKAIAVPANPRGRNFRSEKK